MTSYQCGNLLKRTGGSDVEVFNSVFAENVSGRIVEEHVLSKIWCRGWYWLLCDECVKTMHAIGDRLFSDIQDKRTNKIRGLKTWTGRIDPPPQPPYRQFPRYQLLYYLFNFILWNIASLRHELARSTIRNPYTEHWRAKLATGRTLSSKHSRPITGLQCSERRLLRLRVML